MVLFITIITGCEKDEDCQLKEQCKNETGSCELTTQASNRQPRKVEMCLHDGQCPSRFRCVVFFCVYIGPDEIAQRHEDPMVLINKALKNKTLN